jgi:hypothetical protein
MKTPHHAENGKRDSGPHRDRGPLLSDDPATSEGEEDRHAEQYERW